jgi:hypothetical protein
MLRPVADGMPRTESGVSCSTPARSTSRSTRTSAGTAGSRPSGRTLLLSWSPSQMDFDFDSSRIASLRLRAAAARGTDERAFDAHRRSHRARRRDGRDGAVILLSGPVAHLGVRYPSRCHSRSFHRVHGAARPCLPPRRCTCTCFPRDQASSPVNPRTSTTSVSPSQRPRMPAGAPRVQTEPGA